MRCIQKMWNIKLSPKKTIGDYYRELIDCEDFDTHGKDTACFLKEKAIEVYEVKL